MTELIDFLKLYGLDVELKRTTSKTELKSKEFSLAAGLWENYQINSSELREQAWKRI